jgi:hypothetical protein
MPQSVYFALPEELRDALKRLGSTGKYDFVHMGMFDSPDVPYYSSLEQWQNLGKNRGGALVHGDSFLVQSHGSSASVETVEQVKGGVKHFVSQKGNPHSAELLLPGTYGDDALVAGRIATVSKEGEGLYRALRRFLLKGYRNIKGWYVSPGAYEWLRAGKRLTTNAKAPHEYDLRE